MNTIDEAMIAILQKRLELSKLRYFIMVLRLEMLFMTYMKYHFLQKVTF